MRITIEAPEGLCCITVSYVQRLKNGRLALGVQNLGSEEILKGEVIHLEGADDDL